MKVTLVDKETSHTFTFSSVQAVAIVEREKFKQELTAIISSNRSLGDSKPHLVKPLAPPTIPTSNGLPVVAATGPAGNQRPLIPPASATPRSISRTPVPDDRRGTPLFTGSDPASEFRLRKKVLLSNPELGALHRDLVMTGQITEAEFWDGREVRDIFFHT